MFIRSFILKGLKGLSKFFAFSIWTFLMLSLQTGCTKSSSKETIWIYTSLYKDTINDIQSKLEKAFPDANFQFYQAGSEDVAAKVQAEDLAGQIQADILITSDRFWFEDLAKKGKFLSFKNQMFDKIPDNFKNADGFYATVSYPVMVMAYNTDQIKDHEAPQSFKELSEEKWKDKVSMGSPLASGTTFTTVAFLSKKYDWDYFKSLRKNNIIAEGGNSGVIRRLQSNERPIGIVLLENLLRLTTDKRIKMIVPKDGAILQSNDLAIIKKSGNQELAKKVTDWLYGQEGQEAMVRSYMYAVVPGHKSPVGAPDFLKLEKSSLPWSRDFLSEIMNSREKIKDQFSKIIY